MAGIQLMFLIRHPLMDLHILAVAVADRVVLVLQGLRQT
jgi:hypothetical protein